MTKLPEIKGHVWIGSEPITLDDLSGKVVLIDFWTYSCINCLRTLPYLREWHKKYKDDGLVIIGIHTPEFEFEMDPVNVEKAIKEYDITWPVLLDNEKENWDNFENQYWPAKYLTDTKGDIVYTHFGEGASADTERKIRELLGMNNPDTKEDWEVNEHKHGATCGVATPETYCGYMRGNLMNDLGYGEDVEEVYVKSDLPLEEGRIQLEGKFFATEEYVESRDPKAELSLLCRGSEINLVLSPVGKESSVEILWNGKPLTKEIRGEDVTEDSSVIINRPGLFRIIKSKNAVEGTITIRPGSGKFRAHAFTFSGCVDSM